MELLSINIGMPRPVELGGEMITTGICKTPVAGPVMLSVDGLEGDGVGNTKHHGGPDQAALAYAADHYDDWGRELDRDDLAYGLMGENLTVRGWVDKDVCVGDTYRVGEALVQVTSHRTPCGKLENRVGAKGFSKRYSETGRYGLYLRVLEPGQIQAGDEVALVDRSPSGLGVVELGDLFLNRPKDVDGMRRALAVDGLGVRMREAFEKRIAAAAG